jgi:hypothetical protein
MFAHPYTMQIAPAPTDVLPFATKPLTGKIGLLDEKATILESHYL